MKCIIEKTENGVYFKFIDNNKVKIKKVKQINDIQDTKDFLEEFSILLGLPMGNVNKTFLQVELKNKKSKV